MTPRRITLKATPPDVYALRRRLAALHRAIDVCKYWRSRVVLRVEITQAQQTLRDELHRQHTQAAERRAL
jgi:hypothetical protein